MLEFASFDDNRGTENILYLQSTNLTSDCILALVNIPTVSYKIAIKLISLN